MLKNKFKSKLDYLEIIKNPKMDAASNVRYQGVYQLVFSIFPEFSMSSRVFSKIVPECLSGKMYGY